MVRFMRVSRRAGTGPRAGCRWPELTQSGRAANAQQAVASKLATWEPVNDPRPSINVRPRRQTDASTLKRLFTLVAPSGKTRKRTRKDLEKPFR